MRRKSKKVTMQDVAQRAGVSYQTVSRVLNNSCNVSDRTREKIERVIEELKYVPNAFAQQLGRKQSNYVGLISVSFLIDPFGFDSSINKYIEDSGYKLSISIASDTNLSVESIDQRICDFKARLIDKVIINAPLFKDDAIALHKKHDDIRLLFLDVEPCCHVLSVNFNYFDGANAASKHIKNLGHKNVAIISGPNDSLLAQVRYKSYVDAITANDLNLKAEVYGDWSCESGFATTMKILHEQSGISALFLANNQMAKGAIAALNEMHMAVPDDMSVLSFGNSIDSANWNPCLTTIDLNHELQCRIAVDSILDDNSGRSSSYLPTKLIVRKSTGKCLDPSEKDIIDNIDAMARASTKLTALLGN